MLGAQQARLAASFIKEVSMAPDKKPASKSPAPAKKPAQKKKKKSKK
jgi:hypothetical protein